MSPSLKFACLVVCSVWLVPCGTRGAFPTPMRETTDKKDKKDIQNEYGKHFVLGFINPSNSGKDLGKFTMFVTALKNNTKVRVYIPCTSFNKIYVVKTRNKILKIEIPNGVIMADTKLEKKGVKVSANGEIKLYVFGKNSQSNSSKGDGFIVHPAKSLGLEYIATSYGGTQYSLGIIGVYNGTKVNVVLSKDAQVVYGHRVYKSGQILNFSVDSLHTALITSAHMSGVRVVADKPVAVFSGARCSPTAISTSCGHYVKQLPAMATWGTEFIIYTGKSKSTRGGLLRVAGAAENTVVTVKDGVRTTLGITGVMDLVIKPRVPILVSCSPRCTASLYTDLSNARSDIGLLMTIVQATTQFLSHYTFYVPNRELSLGFLSLVIKCSSTGGMVMNDVQLSNVTWTASSSGVWCGSTVEGLRFGINKVHHKDGMNFGAMVTGVGDGYSYTYYGGRSFVVQSKIGKGPTKEPNTTSNSNIVHVRRAITTKEKSSFKIYKFATIGLATLCVVLLLILTALLFRNRSRHTKQPAMEESKNIYLEPKQLNESDYQTIKKFPSFRGLPRRNTHSYETVKLPVKNNTHTPVADVFSPSETGQDYENVKTRNRDSNPYVPMDQALVECALTGSAVVLPGKESDIYLTMKKSFMAMPETNEEGETWNFL